MRRVLGNKGPGWVDRCRMVVVIEDKEGKEKGRGAFDASNHPTHLPFFNHGHVNPLSA